jgi:hydroxymethylpyrimidine pyrophosphatase-like HAD family hydrolase
MIFHQLATDYDGTIAERGRVPAGMLQALQRVRESGRRLILVTGRVLSDLELACPQADQLFDIVVGENGGVFKVCKTREVRQLGAAPEPALLAALEGRRVAFSTGMCSIHLSADDADRALSAIRETGVGRTLIFNRRALMLLPSEVTKGVALRAVLKMLGTSLHNTVAIGDGENDHAFLSVCELSVAVGDAVPALKDRADYVTRAPGPRGSAEFIEEHLVKDMAALVHHVPRHQLRLGQHDERPVTLPVHGTNLLVVGPSGSGKSTLAGVLVERLVESGRTLVLFDPEGDYDSLAEIPGVVLLGGKEARALPTRPELEQLLRQTQTSLVLNLSAMNRPEKVSYATQALAGLAAVRGATGLPHWIVIDEAHHLMPEDGSPPADVLSSLDEGLCLISLAADQLPPEVRRLCNALASTRPDEFLRAQAALDWKPRRAADSVPMAAGEMLLAQNGGPAETVRFVVDERRSTHRRHVRKYAEGELPPDRSFYFRGPQGRLNLRAANLIRFCELAEGLDEATWDFHRRRHEYSAWIRERIKDPELAQDAEALESDGLDGAPARQELLQAIRRRYAV